MRAPSPPTPPGAVVVVDGAEAVCLGGDSIPQTAAGWLTEWTPAGVYTAMVTKRGQTQIVQWHEHVVRMRLMLSELVNSDPASFPGGLVLPPSDQAMEALLRPTVELALERLVEDQKLSTEASGSNDVVDQSPRESMVVVAISPTSKGAWKIGAHAVVLPAVTSPQAPAKCVVVKNSARKLPSVKDTRWPSQRNEITLEVKHKFSATDAFAFDEILLSDVTDDVLLEGGVTNVFVVVEGVGTEGNTTTVVQTAPISQCLAGVGRASILKACVALGITVVETAPNLSQSDTWSEAFLTNAVRGVRRVGEITWDDGNKVFSEKESEVTKRLADFLAAKRTV